MQGAVVLKPRDPSGLKRFIAAVSDRRSASYGRYLRPGAFAARFGPTTAAVDAIKAQLRARGLRVGAVSSSGLLVRFSGTAPPAVSAMTRPTARCPACRSRRPAGAVAAVVGPGTTAASHPADVPHPLPSQVGRHPAARSGPFHHPAGSPRACRAARAASVGADGLTDDQIAHAYGAFGLYAAGDRGAGQRIAIYENEPFLRSDIRTFDTCFFGAAQAAAMQRRLHVIPVDGGQPTGPGTGEASLDVEDVSALAPGATIDVYVGPYTGANPNDLRLAQRVRGDRRRRPRPGDQHQLGAVRAVGPARTARAAAGRERALPAGRRAGPDGVQRRRRQRLRRLQYQRQADPRQGTGPGLGRRPLQPALRGGRRRLGDQRRRPPAADRAGLERRTRRWRRGRRNLSVLADARLAAGRRACRGSPGPAGPTTATPTPSSARSAIRRASARRPPPRPAGPRGRLPAGYCPTCRPRATSTPAR